jgi:hypothetical protein
MLLVPDGSSLAVNLALLAIARATLFAAAGLLVEGMRRMVRRAACGYLPPGIGAGRLMLRLSRVERPEQSWRKAGVSRGH